MDLELNNSNMKNTIAVLFLILGSVSIINAQDTNLIVGKWKFEDATPKAKVKMDSTGLKMLPMFFGDMSLFLRDDKRFEFQFMGKKTHGSWGWNEDFKSIKMSSDIGEVTTATILEISDSTLILALIRGEFIMKRITPSPENVSVEKPFKIEGVSATLDEVAKKWYLKSRSGGHRTKYSSDFDKMFSRDLWMKFHKHGKFEAEILMIVDEAVWEFGPGNKSIIITWDEEVKVWVIESVKETEMVLRRGNSDELWTFTTKFPKH